MLYPMKEKWKDVVGFETEYQVSNLGAVRSKDRLSKEYLNGKTHTVKGIIRRPSVKNGYKFCWLYGKDGTRKMQYVHRLVAEAFVPTVSGKLYVDHKDRNRLNNAASNLRWVTPGENIRNTSRKVKGYYFIPKKSKYHVRLKVSGKYKHLGFFENEADAHCAYVKGVLAMLR